MKTVFVVYAAENATKKSLVGDRRYAFNTKENLKEGDVISSEEYSTAMHVVKVLDKSYKYFNRNTGDLSDEISSTQQWEIKELVFKNIDSEVVYFSFLNIKE